MMMGRRSGATQNRSVPQYGRSPSVDIKFIKDLRRWRSAWGVSSLCSLRAPLPSTNNSQHVEEDQTDMWGSIWTRRRVLASAGEPGQSRRIDAAFMVRLIVKDVCRSPPRLQPRSKCVSIFEEACKPRQRPIVAHAAEIRQSKRSTGRIAIADVMAESA